jgi:hypothetical protein
MLSGLINIEEKTTLLSIDQIKIDGGTQMRAGLHEQTVVEYMEAMAPVGWSKFPPVIVYHDGESYWLADGFHRVEAFRRVTAELGLQDTKIPADVRAGTRRDAILYAAGANATHGLRRTNADKRRAVETLLQDEEWRQWSDREIARRCHVSHNFVNEIRRSLSSDDSERRYTTKHGTTAIMNTARIGTSRTANKDDIKAATWGDKPYAQIWEIQKQKRATETDAPNIPAPVPQQDVAEQLFQCINHSATFNAEQQRTILKEMMLGRCELYRQMLAPWLDIDEIEPDELRVAARRAYMRLLDAQMRSADMKPTQQSDTRIAQMSRLINIYSQTIATFDEYSALTGCFVEVLPAKRELEKLIRHLRREISLLNGEAVSETFA